MLQGAKHSSYQPNADLQVHSTEVRVPSWAATALTFAIAFAAGVVLAQFTRGGRMSRSKPGKRSALQVTYYTINSLHLYYVKISMACE